MGNIPYILLGAAFMALGGISLAKGNKIGKKRSACTEGSIIEVKEELISKTDKAGSGERHRYTPIFGYSVEGRDYTCRGVYAYDDKKRFKAGDKVQIWYDPLNPKNAGIKEEQKGRGKTGVEMIVFGGLLSVLA